ISEYYCYLNIHVAFQNSSIRPHRVTYTELMHLANTIQKKKKMKHLSRKQIEKKLKRVPPGQYEQLTQQYECLSSSFSSRCSHETLINVLKHCVISNKLVLKIRVPLEKYIGHWEELIMCEYEEIVVVNKFQGMNVRLSENNNKYKTMH
ncbi:hypothetical protein RFI_37964, partial [Reticulomyxa filosa]